MTDTTPTPFTVTRLADMLIACDGHPGHDGYGWQDSYADENIEREVRGHQAVLNYRAQERQAKAAADQERKAGVQALLDVGAPSENPLPSQRLMANRLYDAGLRLPVSAPVDPDPELTALRAQFPKGMRVTVVGTPTWVTGYRQEHLAGRTVTVNEVSRANRNGMVIADGDSLAVAIVEGEGDQSRTWVLPQYLTAVPTEPRAFQVGDVVRISDDATTSMANPTHPQASLGRGKTGRVGAPADSDGGVLVVDLTDDARSYSPDARFLTLIAPGAKS